MSGRGVSKTVRGQSALKKASSRRELTCGAGKGNTGKGSKLRLCADRAQLRKAALTMQKGVPPEA